MPKRGGGSIGNHEPTVVFPFSPVERDLAGPNRKRRALSCDMAASANAPPLGVAFGSALPKFQPWACPRFLIPNFLRASAAWALRMAL